MMFMVVVPNIKRLTFGRRGARRKVLSGECK